MRKGALRGLDADVPQAAVVNILATHARVPEAIGARCGRRDRRRARRSLAASIRCSPGWATCSQPLKTRGRQGAGIRRRARCIPARSAPIARPGLLAPADERASRSQREQCRDGDADGLYARSVLQRHQRDPQGAAAGGGAAADRRTSEQAPGQSGNLSPRPSTTTCRSASASCSTIRSSISTCWRMCRRAARPASRTATARRGRSMATPRTSPK